MKLYKTEQEKPISKTWFLYPQALINQNIKQRGRKPREQFLAPKLPVA